MDPTPGDRRMGPDLEISPTPAGTPCSNRSPYSAGGGGHVPPYLMHHLISPHTMPDPYLTSLSDPLT